MNLRFFSGMVDDNYGWELELFRKNRNLKDGFTGVEFKVNLDKYPCDHNPKFEFSLILCNFIIFDFEVYNVWHVENERSPFYGRNNDSDGTWKDCVALYHSREKFYENPNMYWYSFNEVDDQGLSGVWVNEYVGSKIPSCFLKVPDTKYYEYGGGHEEAMLILKLAGFKVVEGKEI